MDAVTYPDPAVAEFIRDRIIPVRVAFDAQPLSTDFNVKWTPTLVTLDETGAEHHRTVGFLPPEELIPSLLLGSGKCGFDRDRLEEALAAFDALLSAYPNSDAAPEAIYLRGVARFKVGHDPSHLKQAYEQLDADYPTSEWRKRAYAYRLL